MAAAAPCNVLAEADSDVRAPWGPTRGRDPGSHRLEADGGCRGRAADGADGSMGGGPEGTGRATDSLSTSACCWRQSRKSPPGPRPAGGSARSHRGLETGTGGWGDRCCGARGSLQPCSGRGCTFTPRWADGSGGCKAKTRHCCWSLASRGPRQPRRRAPASRRAWGFPSPHQDSTQL